MKQKEKKLSGYIDRLNSERIPKEHIRGFESEEFADITQTVRRVRMLKGIEMPDKVFERTLFSTVRGEGNGIRKADPKEILKKRIRRTLVGAAAISAVAGIIIATPYFTADRNRNIVYAMEQALRELKAYHGIIELEEYNELGEKTLLSRREVWADDMGNYYIKELEGFSKGSITVNNTLKEWQIRPDERKVYISSALLDPYRFTFEIGNEIKNVKNALTVKEIGEEILSGRETVLLEVTPEGGKPYHLWVDKETELPLKRLSAMQNALQTSISYIEIEFTEEIPKEFMQYQVPEGYSLVEDIPELLVTSLEESKELTGLIPVVPKKIPEGYSLSGIAVLTDSNAIRLYYKTENGKHTIVIQEAEAEDELLPASNAMLGVVGGSIAEFLNNYEGVNGVSSIRWLEKGLEFTVYGNATKDVLNSFVSELAEGEVVWPMVDGSIYRPGIEVPINMEAEENDQKSVDAGHSPWKLDPVFVAHVFVNLLISPEGIVGDYPIPYEAVELVDNNGVEAKVKINDEKSIAEYVYLKRLIRQDDSGIWTVVGYDPVQ